MPVDKDGGSRHYRGPEQQAVPMPPPQPRASAAVMPPAEELVQDDPVDAAFALWCQEARVQGDTFTSATLFRAFLGGIEYAKQARLAKVRETKPEELEGTVESRTLIAALTFFKEQVLLHGPEEIRTGEWMNARDVDVLIQSIAEDGRRRAAGREQ